MRETPPWVGDESALIVLDWSWWLNKSYRLFELEGMTGNVVGWLCSLLSYEPAHLCIALDTNGETWRHKVKHPTDEQWRYKAGRDPKPSDFYRLSDRCTEIAELHSIPVLWADGYEADDIIATVTAKARTAGYRVYICSADKDLHALCEADERSGIVCATWSNHDGWTRGPVETREKFGVEPAQMPDYLAITGDKGDNVPGVFGLGDEKAAWLLGQFGTLEGALSHPPFTPEQHASLDARVKQLAKEMKKAGEDRLADLTVERDKLMQARKVARWHATLLENADVARFSRELTSLDCDAPIVVPWADLPVGGFQVDALKQRYESLGYTAKAREVRWVSKREPWCIPY